MIDSICENNIAQRITLPSLMYCRSLVRANNTFIMIVQIMMVLHCDQLSYTRFGVSFLKLDEEDNDIMVIRWNFDDQ